jgi:hypothetical protein
MLFSLLEPGFIALSGWATMGCPPGGQMLAPAQLLGYVVMEYGAGVLGK